MLAQIQKASGGADRIQPSTPSIRGRPPARSRLSQSGLALLATASLLNACATVPASMRLAATGEGRVEPTRELRHFGHQGNSEPAFVNRRVRTRAPADVGAESPVWDR